MWSVCEQNEPETGLLALQYRKQCHLVQQLQNLGVATQVAETFADEFHKGSLFARATLVHSTDQKWLGPYRPQCKPSPNLRFFLI